VSKNCITTMVNGWYKHFIPMFEYSAKKAMPDVDVRVYDMDKTFPGYHRSSVNALRFFVDPKEFKGYDYVYFTDVDFIFLPHDNSLFDYHTTILNVQGYSGHRGPINARNRKFKAWDGDRARIAAGAFMVNQKWFKRTERTRRGILPVIMNGVNLREADEILLQKILVESGYKIPTKAGRFCDGHKYNIKYRDIHLGDFKPLFSRWKDIKKMRRRFLCDSNVIAYQELKKDPVWIEIVQKACENKHVNNIIRNMRWHMRQRLKCIYS